MTPDRMPRGLIDAYRVGYRHGRKDRMFGRKSEELFVYRLADDAAATVVAMYAEGYRDGWRDADTGNGGQT